MKSTLTISCWAVVGLMIATEGNLCFGQPDQHRSFSMNLVTAKTGYSVAQTMDITWNVDSAIVTRQYPVKANASFPSNSLFDVTGRVRLATNGQFHWADGDVPLWFIPFGNGVPAVRVSDIRDCMFFVCNCGGQFSRYEDVQCYPHADQQNSIISCATLGDHSCPGRGIRDCAGSVAILPCEETERDPGLYYEHYPGGILIQTHKIKVVEPADFAYPNNTVDFIYIEGEGIYLKSDYERYQQKED